MQEAAPETPMVEHALAWASLGYRVFPLHPGTKNPIYPRFPEFATTDHEKIKRWWADHPNANVGHIPSHSGHYVVDLDTKDDRHWKQEDVDRFDLPPSNKVARTTSGGEHRWYRLAGGELLREITKDRLGEGIDGKCIGFVVMPGSRYGGGEYEKVAWSEEPSPQVSPAFVNLAGRRSDARDGSGAGKDPDYGHIVKPDLLKNVKGSIRWLRDEVPGAIEGQNGDNHTISVARGLWDRGISRELAWKLMDRYWNARCEPPWPDEDSTESQSLRTKVWSAYGGDLENPFGYKTSAHVLAERGNVVSLFSKVEANVEAGGVFNFLHLADLDSLPEPDWTLKDAIPFDMNDSPYVMLYGSKNARKTYVAIDIACSILVAKPLNDGNRKPRWTEKEIFRPGPVLYIAGEGAGTIRPRMNRWLHTYWKENPTKEELRSLDFHLVRPTPQALGDSVAAFMKEARGKVKVPRLIVIDTLTYFMSGLNSNQPQEGTMVVEAIKRMCPPGSGTTVLVIHHDKKDGSDAWGSSVIKNSADIVLKLTEEPSAGDTHFSKLTVENSRHGLKDLSWGYQFKTDHLEDGKTQLVPSRCNLFSSVGENSPEPSTRRVDDGSTPTGPTHGQGGGNSATGPKLPSRAELRKARAKDVTT